VYGSARGGTRPTLYFPLAQSADMGPRTSVSISIRSTTGSPALLAPSVTAALTAINRNLAFSFRPLEVDVNAALTRERVVAMLAGFFGALALLLSAIGLYGISSYAVARRRLELGIRLALGATPASVTRLVISRVSVLVGLGLIIGVSLAMWASTFVAPLLYGLEPGDPLTIAGAAVVLAAVGGLASSPAAVRAALIDPAETLRQS
jgi:ABC-type antimicrobial peptide transport system permease subunit